MTRLLCSIEYCPSSFCLFCLYTYYTRSTSCICYIVTFCNNHQHSSTTMAVSPTTTQVAEPQKVEAATNNAAAAPRKRRRRAPATGATEDCFACKKRQVKCDRRRPYCGQCVEIGKECSGYRTTLTWGVGVASRGKLRGMTLPVAKSPPSTTTQEPKTQRMNSIASTSTSSVSSGSHQDQHRSPSNKSSTRATSLYGFPMNRKEQM